VAKTSVKKPSKSTRPPKPASKKKPATPVAKKATRSGAIKGKSAAARPVASKPQKAVAPVKKVRPAVIERPAKKLLSKPFNHVPLPPAPVTTDSRPKKNQAGINSRDLEHFRELLLAKRRELVGDMSSMEREALRVSTGTNLSNLPLHMADMGTDNYEQEFTLGLVEKDRQLLREINQALAKIQDGSYGICEGTGRPISRPRLEAQPWAKYSIEHARLLEKGMIRR
jgi:DnaK suppressor protein